MEDEADKYRVDVNFLWDKSHVLCQTAEPPTDIANFIFAKEK